VAIQKPTLNLLRQLTVAIGGEADAVTRDLTRAWTRSWDDLSVAWKSAMGDVVAKAAATGEWPPAWELGRMERLGRAVGESETALTQLSKRAGIEVTDGAGKVVALDTDYEPRLVSSQLPAAEAAAAAAVYSARVTPTALDFIVARSQSQIASTLIPLSADATDAMRRELVRGIAVGANPNVAAAQMIDRVEGAFNGGLSRAINIARTEMLDAYRTASRYSHAANADVVSGWTWHSALDARTCPACWSMHGRTFPVTQPGPLGHQQCRCSRLPRTKSWADLGFNVAEPADEIPDAQSTFRALSADKQRAIMGPGRLELLNSGKVGWNDLASLRGGTGWRQSYTSRAVVDLQRIANGRAVTSLPLTPSPLPPALVRQIPSPRAALPSPVAAVTDPALKMTVAALKQIAKDNKIPLNILGTRKADIIAGLRSWERTYVVKLKGLPEFKPPPPQTAVPAIQAPPLAPPAPGGPVLSGARFNDWDDEFRYGPLGTTKDTPAAGFRVKDLRILPGALDGSYPSYVVDTGTAWRFNEVSYLIEHGPNDFGAPWVSRALVELRAAHDAIPGASRANKSYAILFSRNPADVYWQIEFNDPLHTAAMSAGQGRVSIWNFRPGYSRVEIDPLRHETGHNLDYLVGRTTAGSQSPAWTAAANADAITAARITNLNPTHPEATKLATVDHSRGFPRGVTDYGRSSAAEDYAESVMLYQLGPIATGRLPGVVIPKLPGVKLPPGAVAVTDREILYFRDIFPERATILDKLFPDIATAQKAEILFLRDPAKLTVTQLRALAKARNLVVPAKAPKADILALLQGKPIAKAAGDLTKMTVPQLRALAKERGIKIPTGAKKADIVALLDKKAVAFSRPAVDALPRTKAKVVQGQAARATNPNFGTTYNGPTYRDAGRAGKRWTPDMGPVPSGAYEENCSNVVYAFEMRMRGYDIKAAPLDVLDKHGYAAGRTYAEMDKLLTDAWRLPGGGAHGRSLSGQAWRSFAEIDEEIVQLWPDGGRGMIFVGKHIFNVVKVRGKVQYVEAQYDANASRIVTALYKKKYRAGAGSLQEAKLIRLDDLEPTDAILDAVKVIEDADVR